MAESPRAGAPELVKMATLAARSGVPAATIKHYVREGLLPGPTLRTGRNMAYYDAGLVPRIRSIKALQREHFLPLKIIKDKLDAGGAPPDPERAATAIGATLRRMAREDSRTRAELVRAGLPADELAFFEAIGVVTPHGSGANASFAGDDLELLRTLGDARRRGITREMLPFTALAPYVRAVQALVDVEISLLQRGILPNAGDRIDEVLEAATTLSERLVVLLRRRLIVPTLKKLAAAPKAPPARRGGRRRGRRT